MKREGVNFNKDDNTWWSRITKDGVTMNLGRFKTENEAALAYNNAAVALHKQFAVLNTVKGDDLHQTN
jgi:AP2-like factor (euAP2 lineage)